MGSSLCSLPFLLVPRLVCGQIHFSVFHCLSFYKTSQKWHLTVITELCLSCHKVNSIWFPLNMLPCQPYHSGTRYVVREYWYYLTLNSTSRYTRLSKLQFYLVVSIWENEPAHKRMHIAQGSCQGLDEPAPLHSVARAFAKNKTFKPLNPNGIAYQLD